MGAYKRGVRRMDFFHLVIRWLEEHSEAPLKEIGNPEIDVFWDDVENPEEVRIRKDGEFEIEFVDRWGITHRAGGRYNENK